MDCPHGMTKQNKILAISNHGHMMGGGEYSFSDVLARLSAICEVLAVIPEEGGLDKKLKKNRIRTRVISLPSIKPWFVHKILKSMKTLIGFGVRQRCSLIYANGSRAAFYGGIAGWITRIPMVWHCRIASPDPHLDLILTWLSTRIIANSLATGKRFKKAHRKKVRVVYNGVDLNWLQEGTAEKPLMVQPDWRVILIVARASKSKRHDLAIDAFERVAQMDPNLHMVCIGAEDKLASGWWKHLQQKSEDSLFSDRIHWIGQVEDVRPWYRSATLLLSPSDIESFGRVLVEAMACGVPVIATRSGGVPEIVREGIDGILVTPGSANEVREAAQKLLRDESLRKNLSESGRKRAEEFSLETHVNQMVQVFEETLRCHARRVAR
jgi:glycosyltransferase involved in cell wall biosynthesis